ncbi:MAG: SinI family restriction endonuclease, partial [Terriglobales bacterium]
VANGAEQKAPENPETNSLDITHDEKRQEKHRIHQFFSSLLGDLLERYVAPVLQESGWLWCAGRLVKTVDFLKPGEPLHLLQVKNSFNSENSSGSGYRVEGGVPSWHRRNGNGTFNWAELEDNDGSLTEDGFQAYVKEQVAKVSSSGNTGEQ